METNTDQVYTIASVHVGRDFGIIHTTNETVIYCERRFAETAKDDKLTKVILDKLGNVQCVYS